LGTLFDSLRHADHLTRDQRREVRVLEAKAEEEAKKTGSADVERVIPSSLLPPIELEALPNPANLFSTQMDFSEWENKDQIQKVLRRARLRRPVSLAIRYKYLRGMPNEEIAKRLHLHLAYVPKLFSEGLNRLRHLASLKPVRYKEDPWQRTGVGPSAKTTCPGCGKEFSYLIFKQWAHNPTKKPRRQFKLRHFCSPRCVRFYYKQGKLPSTAELERLCLEGWSAVQIAKLYNCTPRPVRHKLQQAGLKASRFGRSDRPSRSPESFQQSA
jgi:DNA-directed RNA polymerase specialized sigma24 family protein